MTNYFGINAHGRVNYVTRDQRVASILGLKRVSPYILNSMYGVHGGQAKLTPSVFI